MIDGTVDQQFAEITKRTMPKMRRFALMLTNNWADADDLLQMTYLKAYRYARRVCEVESPDAYLRQILVRTCIDERRKHRVTEICCDDLPDMGVTTAPDDDKWEMRPALAKIAYSQRQILILRFYFDLSVPETAAFLGCTAGTVKSQTSRGLNSLARNLGITRPVRPQRCRRPDVNAEDAA
jgi:RNA polymerase sigma-70 factor (sigma-E family)